jgi:hypothetical protein
MRLSASIPSKFQRHQRICSSDGAGSIAKCEKGLCKSLGAVSLLHIFCEVHISAGIREKTMMLMNEQVARTIHVSLSLGFGTRMQSLRKELREFLRATLKLVRGTPLASNRAKLHTLLDLFFFSEWPRQSDKIAQINH